MVCGTTGLGGNFPFTTIVVVLVKANGVKIIFIGKTAAKLKQYLKLPYIASNKLVERIKSNNLPPKFISLSCNAPIWNIIKNKNAKLIQQYPDRSKRLEAASMLIYIYL